MLKTLEQLSMPSRADIVSIAERMTNIEMRLDDLDTKLDGMQELVAKAVVGARSAASTTPKAPKKTVRSEQVRKGKR
jgi:hypothetical protein